MNKLVITIDPGSVQSAFIVTEGSIIDKGIILNDLMVSKLLSYGNSDAVVVIEEIKSYGMPVGQSVIDTCYIIGRLVQVCIANGIDYHMVPRKTIVTSLCGSSNAGDTNVRQVLRDNYTKTQLKGIKYDLWASLAIYHWYISDPSSPLRTGGRGGSGAMHSSLSKKDLDDFLSS